MHVGWAAVLPSHSLRRYEQTSLYTKAALRVGFLQGISATLDLLLPFPRDWNGLYADGCHLNERGHTFVSRQLMRCIDQCCPRFAPRRLPKDLIVAARREFLEASLTSSSGLTQEANGQPHEEAAPDNHKNGGVMAVESDDVEREMGGEGGDVSGAVPVNEADG
uniref:Uncharacterized protein n=1 Tax=Vitrella brassicaformis TaxID=1169539 RepID=A0A7S1PFC7_9ALVE|mmetsp:Transcript_7034/g.17092  ORF Transcript_7034/g.17092 Transcript_7034/m.17092 type:complete len:164 (+) Transcript_7034:32-523(+)